MNEQTIGQRIILTVIIVVLVLAILALIGWATGRWEDRSAQSQTREPQLYQGIPLDKHLLELDKRALESAYQAHLTLLWSVWLKDAAPQDAVRISNGLKIARRAYHQAATQIEQRQQELDKK